MVRLMVCRNKKAPGRRMFVGWLAERVGFEPTVGSPLRLISSQVHSTTLPPLLHLCRAVILAEPNFTASGYQLQGRLGATTAALRGATVKAMVPPINVPSLISTVAVRSCLVKTSKLVLPRTAEIRVQPWAG